MVKVCFRPKSSSQLQRSVPICTFDVLVPANPFTTLPDGRSVPTKSSLTWDIHPEHRLSIPIVSESVSNWVILSVATVACACIARTVIASAVPLDRQPDCFRLFRWCPLRLTGLVLSRIQSPKESKVVWVICQHFSHVDMITVFHLLILDVLLLCANHPNACLVVHKMVTMMGVIDQHKVSNNCTIRVLVHPPRHSLSSDVASFSAVCSILAINAFAILSCFSTDFFLSDPVESLLRLSPVASVDAKPLHSFGLWALHFSHFPPVSLPHQYQVWPLNSTSFLSPCLGAFHFFG
jgi:hypothetical protein